jgi:arylsulfatase A-like enzyme
MNRRHFLKKAGTTVAALATLGMSNPQPKKKPNLLFILVDDLGWSDLSCYGNSIHETPHVDQLAKQGMRFTQAYTACAVCSPTRASIQTGKYPIRMGITDWIPGARKKGMPLEEKYTKTQMPLEEVTVAEAFKKAGYQTSFVGKWHLGETEKFWPEFQGYDINLGGHSKGSPPGGYFSPYNNPRLPNGPEGEYLTDRLGDEAVKLIEQYSQSPQPFFMMMSFYTVHTPIQPQSALNEKYIHKIEDTKNDHWNNPGYAAMVQSMDENVGKILDALKHFALEQDTIVIFTSDNGGLIKNHITSNYPLSLGKGFYHEGGIRVPTVIRWPGVIRPGSVSECPIISMDYYPTMLEMAGLSLMPEQHIDGLSLLPLLKGESKLKRDTFYWHYPHYHGAGETPCSAIRVGNYKFIRHYETNQKELYNLKNDVGEENNLIEKLPLKASELEQKLDAWLRKMNAYIPS